MKKFKSLFSAALVVIFLLGFIPASAKAAVSEYIFKVFAEPQYDSYYTNYTDDHLGGIVNFNAFSGGMAAVTNYEWYRNDRTNSVYKYGYYSLEKASQDINDPFVWPAFDGYRVGSVGDFDPESGLAQILLYSGTSPNITAYRWFINRAGEKVGIQIPKSGEGEDYKGFEIASYFEFHNGLLLISKNNEDGSRSYAFLRYSDGEAEIADGLGKDDLAEYWYVDSFNNGYARLAKRIGNEDSYEYEYYYIDTKGDLVDGVFNYEDEPPKDELIYPNNITWDTWSYENDSGSREYFSGSRNFKDADGNEIALPEGYNYTNNFVYSEYHDGYMWVEDRVGLKMGIIKLADPVSGTVTINGNAAVGNTLTVDLADAVPSDAASYDVTWQWKPSSDSDWIDVTDDTADGLTLTSKYSNKYVRFVAKAAADSDYSGTLISTEAQAEKQSISGKPGINGDGEVGGVLTATLTSVQPELAQSGDFLYKWKRDDSEISGAVNPSYVLTLADSNKNISVEVTAADNSDFTGTSASDQTHIAPIAIAGAVTIGANASPITADTVLTAIVTGVTPQEAQAGLIYQWNDGSGEPATGSTYTVTSEDVLSSSSIYVTVTASADYSGSLDSAPVEVSKTVLTGTVSLDKDEDTLSYTIAPALGDVLMSEQWMRNGVAIPGATDAVYQVVPEDAGKIINIVITSLSDTHTGSLTANSGIAIPASSPGAPSALTVTAGTDSITLVWTPPEFDGGAPIGGYSVKVGDSNPIILSALATEYTFTNLAADTTYTVSVAAFNSVGDGEYASDTVTTGAAIYTVTFNANGGAVSPANALTGTGGKLASLPVPEYSGYRFDGWYTAASGGSQITVDTVFAADVTVYAHWTNTGGGSGVGSGTSTASNPSSTVTAADGAVSVEYTRAGDFITLILPENKVNEIIRKSSQTASIDLTSAANATSAELPAAALAKLAEAELAVEIKLPQGSVAFEAAAAASIAERSGGNVSVSLKAVAPSSLNERQREAAGDAPVFDITVTSGNNAIKEGSSLFQVGNKSVG
ncbi:MAG: InlB B-repeat-containing protein [Clostridiales bacterium]|jgi:uncharacterized repeat protein (TIGR02543 family)|nr:InlB B-repeat-containing protein [Clostridiales bacterium]